MVTAHRFGHLCEVAGALRRDDGAPQTGSAPGDGGQDPGGGLQSEAGQAVPEMLVEGGDALVGEARGDRAEYRKILQGDAGMLPGAGQVAADVPQGVLAAPPLEFVDGDDVCEVEHVDLLELGRRPELRGHDVQGQVAVGGHAGVALADARRLHYHQIETGGPAGGDGVVQAGGQLAARAAGGEGPEEHPGPGHRALIDGVHPDAVAEEGPAPFAPGGIDGQHGNPELVLLVEPEPAHDLVGQRRFARTSRTGDAEYRRRVGRRGGENRLARQLLELPVLRHREGPGQHPLVAGQKAVDVTGCQRCSRVVALGDEGVDHGCQPEGLAVLGRKDPGHPVGLQLGYLGRDDGPSPASVDPYPGATLRPQPVDEVLEVLDVASLVRADGDALGVLLDGRRHDLVHRTVVSEMDHLGPLGLQQPAHDVDGGIVAVEQAGGGHETDRAGRNVERRRRLRTQAGMAGGGGAGLAGEAGLAWGTSGGVRAGGGKNRGHQQILLGRPTIPQ